LTGSSVTDEPVESDDSGPVFRVDMMMCCVRRDLADGVKVAGPEKITRRQPSRRI
jgi:hypothetical protein